MAKKPKRSSNRKAETESAAPQRGVKSEAIRTYLKANNSAMPKQVVAALKEQGISVSPNMVSIIRAQAGVRKARRKATKAVADHDNTADVKLNQAAALEAVLTLYKAARGLETNQKEARRAFLLLVDLLG